MTQAGDNARRAVTELSDGTRLELCITPRPAQASNPAAGGPCAGAHCEGNAHERALLELDPGPLLETLRVMIEARTRTPQAQSSHGLVGQSPAMVALSRMIDRVAGSSASVLITGENGTGKELVARAIHDASPRRDKAFVAVNCSAFNDNLLESEMFGHRRGAFTGAQADKRGLFEEADGGTLFLDEVGDMSPALQVKLLRVLQDGTFMPVGSTTQKRVDVRIIAATNRDLTQLVKTGKFREDLYYRLHVVALCMPALRDRGDDLTRLAEFFLARLNTRHAKQKLLHPDTLARLRAHRFPGNVRELQNEIERVFVLSGEEPVIGPEHLGTAIAPAPLAEQNRANHRAAAARGSAAPGVVEPTVGDAAGAEEPLNVQLERLERDIIERSLRHARGNRTHAAQALGVSRRNLLRKLQQLGLASDDEQSALD